MSASYLSFCPIAKACEVLEPRWTILVLSELLSGARRFNEIRRGLPGMSPTLLSRRLKELEQAGLVVRSAAPGSRDSFYAPTGKAEELVPVIDALGHWAHRHIDEQATLEHLDARILMWNLRQNVDMAAMPPARQWVVKFRFEGEREGHRDFWLVARRDCPVDLCLIDPGQDVDLYVNTSLRAMTAIFLGYSGIRAEVARGTISLVGDRRLAATMGDWMSPSKFAA